ncbi:peptide ABC transporter permease [Tepidimicrobium xylanilyticum]|uniref:Peptide/nickel transport system permease protein n=2 Tax=Tepidimicrobium xylanilyticum TaxID=1123352 RepID=A0A1H3A3Q0_9FIRM|nr:peptide ABC transporter permease [Tepidimicrobium xylanilyticum]SDX24372.1 peptide/nickel transport system permease protein [Tepidimicrobium xylanilyticum]
MAETKAVANGKKNKNKSNSQLMGVWMRLKKNRLAIIGLVILVILILVAIFANIIAPYGYDEQDLQNTFQTPSLKHLFGTDEFGRDIFSRIIYGSRISLQVGVIAVGIAVVVGGFLGAVAGYFSGKVDNVIMRIMDILLSIPQMLLAISIVAALGNSLINLMIAVGVSSIPQYARIVRASVISIKNQEFVESAKATGSSDLRIIFKHVIPNCLAPVIVQATLGIGLAILTAAGLSFIGLGIKPPTPEWGAMLSGGRMYIRNYPHLTLFPGIAIVITIFAFNVLGDGLRDALDPKLKQ